MSYIEDAKRTLSPFYYDQLNIHQQNANTHLLNFANAALDLDTLKKKVFYGKGLVDAPFINTDVEYEEIKPRLNAYHAMIGIATESGEIVERLIHSIAIDNATGIALPELTPEHKANLIEEMGDVFWYLALLADSIGISFEEIQKLNIDKLKARFPEKFTQEKAVNRNTKKELQNINKKAVD